MKYFDKSKAAPPEDSQKATPTNQAESEVDEITQQASSLDISASHKGQVKGQKRSDPTPPQVSAIPRHMTSDREDNSSGGDSCVRRSPRLAKRARPIVDEVSM